MSPDALVLNSMYMMKTFHTSKYLPSLLLLAIIFGVACKDQENGRETEISETKQIELDKINSLLRDLYFTESMAKALDSSYYVGVQQAPPPFLTAADDSLIITRSARSEKIAMTLAGFYALECGIGLLHARTKQTPVELLQQITAKTMDSGSLLLLNRFANATWKAGQPFRDLTRINRPNFIVASSLSTEEVAKDYYQIFHCAQKLQSSMKPVSKSSVADQMELLRKLLQDTSYAVEITRHLSAARDSFAGQQEERSVLSSNDTTTVRKTSKQMKIATSIAGFYALECAVNYLSTTTHELPSNILKSLVNNSITIEDKMLFARFANATWKAGQPFRDLNRITRATFTPFYFLNEADIEKDLVQIRAAAARMLLYLELIARNSLVPDQRERSVLSTVTQCKGDIFVSRLCFQFTAATSDHYILFPVYCKTGSGSKSGCR